MYNSYVLNEIIMLKSPLMLFRFHPEQSSQIFLDFDVEYPNRVVRT